MASNRDLKKRLALAAPQLGATDVWLPKLIELDKSRLVEALRKDLFQIGELALKATASGKTQQAVNWLVLGFYCDPAAAREALATAGTLRASKYRYQTKHLLKTLAGLDAVAGDLALSGEILAYLNSVKTLVRIAPAVAHMDESLRGFLKRRGKTALKAVVARMDALFMIAHDADPAGDTEDITTYPREELAEAASYIIHCIDEEIGIKATHFGLIPEDEIIRGVFDKVLLKACKIRKFGEAELLVDAFGYRCSASGRTIVVSAPTPELEKSIRLGYILDEQARDQTRLTRVKAMQQGASSVFAIADEFFDRFHDNVVKRLDVPVSRYAFHLPEAPPILALFQGDAVTVEEDFYLREVGNIELVTWNELKRVEYGSGLTLLDLARIHRLFLFFARLARRQLEPLLETEPALTYRSLIPVFKEADLKRLLAWCVQEEHVDDALEFLTWKPGAPGIYDLQYKPIISVENYCLVPLHIAGMTNWYRNLARTGKYRPLDVLQIDAASRALAQALRDADCDFVHQGYETTLEGQKIEIDVVCRFGNDLFLFECKHPVLPCNVHELRTSYKHMNHAAYQLDRLMNLLCEPAIEKEFYRRLDWPVGPSDTIVTCIVSGNGMFSGLRVDGHPVRRLPELVNMIRTGVIRTISASVENDGGLPTVAKEELVERCLWEGQSLTPAFLRTYLEDDRVSSMLFDAMFEYEQIFALEEWRLSFVSYALDIEAAAAAVENLPEGGFPHDTGSAEHAN